VITCYGHTISNPITSWCRSTGVVQVLLGGWFRWMFCNCHGPAAKTRWNYCTSENDPTKGRGFFARLKDPGTRVQVDFHPNLHLFELFQRERKEWG
jgi:hypothetical protein